MKKSSNVIVWKPCRAGCQHGRYVIRQYPAEYDLPICPVCGGLGQEVVSATLHDGKKTERHIWNQVFAIRMARFAYCPYDSREHFTFPPPPCLRARELHYMHAALDELKSILGQELDHKCYAATLLDGDLEKLQEKTEAEVAFAVETWRADPHVKRPNSPTLREAIGLAIAGNMDAADDAFADLLLQGSVPEVRLHAARFYVEYLRDWRRALEQLENLRGLQPPSAEICLELVAAYDALNREAEMRLAFLDALGCPDAGQHPELVEAKRLIDERRGVVKLARSEMRRRSN